MKLSSRPPQRPPSWRLGIDSVVISAAPFLYGEATRRPKSAIGTVGRSLMGRIIVPGLDRSVSVSQESLLGDGPVVCLTSFGQRMQRVHLAIESIGRGLVKPQRLILWVDDQSVLEAPPIGLATQVDRGLELMPARPLGPHTKYFGALELDLDGFVTADDDIVYPRKWLQGMVQAAATSDAQAVGWRGRRMSVRRQRLTPSETWPHAKRGDEPASLFLTGVSGVYYRRKMIEHLAHAGTEFIKYAPTADDVWLNFIRHQAGFHGSLVRSSSLHFPVIPETQTVRLGASNVDQGMNDQYLAHLYDQDILKRLDLGE